MRARKNPRNPPAAPAAVARASRFVRFFSLALVAVACAPQGRPVVLPPPVVSAAELACQRMILEERLPAPWGLVYMGTRAAVCALAQFPTYVVEGSAPGTFPPDGGTGGGTPTLGRDAAPTRSVVAPALPAAAAQCTPVPPPFPLPARQARPYTQTLAIRTRGRVFDSLLALVGVSKRLGHSDGPRGGGGDFPASIEGEKEEVPRQNGTSSRGTGRSSSACFRARSSARAVASPATSSQS